MENNQTALLTEKWAKVLDIESAPKITDRYRRMVTAQLLENQLASMKATARELHTQTLSEDTGIANVSGLQGDVYGAVTSDGTTQTGNGNLHMMGYDPVLINLVRRAMPQLIAFDVCGVQPMSQPTGLIFAMKSKYGAQDGPEALYNEARTDFSGDHGTNQPEIEEGKFKNEVSSNWAEAVGAVDKDGYPTLDKNGYPVVGGMETYKAELAGSGAADGATWNQMAFSIEKTSVVAKSRILRAEYTMELAQDLKSVHGLDAEAELSNILATEILAEINREIVRDIYTTAEWGARAGTVRKGIFDLDVDSDGRWSAEKYKGLMYRIEREANAIGQRTRRGRGNFIICSADVASALQMAGMLDYSPAVQNNLNVDDTQSTFAGVLNGKYKVFIDPYTSNNSDSQYFVVGYKGNSAYDAGMFYCPYVPLQLVKSVDPNTFQPKIGFKTRYGIAFNPQVQLDAGKGTGTINTADMAGKNYYYRKVIVKGL